MPILALVVFVLAVSIFVATRLVLALYSGTEIVPLTLWPALFAKGLGFDLAIASVLVAPVLLYEALLPNRWRAARALRFLRFAWLWSLASLLLLGAVAEIAFWTEFSTRFNFIAVDYLIYTHEVIGQIRESYPVGLLLFAIAAAAAVTSAVIDRMMRKFEPVALSPRRRGMLALAALLLPLIAVTLANIDHMIGSGNVYADELAGNGLFSFAAALRRNELDYDTFYEHMPQHAADHTLEQLGVERPWLSRGSHSLEQDAANDVIPFARRPRNVVLVSVESLSASFVGAYGATTQLTPNIDGLAREGLRFENVFATGTRTVRGLEALSLGIPPVPGQAIVRRPGNEHLATLGELLSTQGVTPIFVYGGYGYFDNMNAYFGANRYRVIDRTDFAKTSIAFENIWGVADESLFDNALKAIDAENRSGKPFFAHVMTTSNHRPFTYPQGRIDIPSPGGRDGAVKYSDYALGRFMEEAKRRPWFADTLFVIVADHCASVAGKTSLPVDKYRIPLIFYAPHLLQAGTYKEVVSQIDLAPTLLEVLGLSGDDNFFGRSFFEAGPHPQRAFISNYQELGYLRNGILTVLLPKRRVQSFRIDPVTDAATPAEVDPQLLREAVAYYQTASRAFKAGALRPIEFAQR